MFRITFQVGEHISRDCKIVTIHNISFILGFRIFVRGNAGAFPKDLTKPAVVGKAAAVCDFAERIFPLVDELTCFIGFKTFDIKRGRFSDKSLEQLKNVRAIEPKVVRDFLHR